MLSRRKFGCLRIIHVLDRSDENRDPNIIDVAAAEKPRCTLYTDTLTTGDGKCG